jgi:hypothetical protein
MWHAWERGEVYAGFLSENVKEENHLEDLGVDESVDIRCQWRAAVNQCWTFGFVKMRGMF